MTLPHQYRSEYAEQTEKSTSWSGLLHTVVLWAENVDPIDNPKDVFLNIDHIMDWCRETVGEPIEDWGITIAFDRSNISVFFRTLEAAILFRLTWG